MAAELLAATCRRLPLRRPDREISVASFNLLLKGFDKKPYYRGERGVPDEYREWPRRKAQLKSIMLGLDADILCAQEVEIATFYQEFDFMEAGGYDSIEPRDKKVTPPRSPPSGAEPQQGSADPSAEEASPQPPDAAALEAAVADLAAGSAPACEVDDMAKCAIFYKRSSFDLVWYNHRSRTLLAALRHKPTDKVVYVCNCHLEGHPTAADVRFSQVKKSLQFIAKDQKSRKIDPAGCCMVFCGDFNGPTDAAVNVCLREGGLAKTARDPWSGDKVITPSDYTHPYALTDAYAPEHPPTFGSPDGPPDGSGFLCIDFLFHTHRTMRLLRRRQPLLPEQLAAARSTYMPCEWHPSDHVPIGAVYDLLQDEEDARVESV